MSVGAELVRKGVTVTGRGNVARDVDVELVERGGAIMDIAYLNCDFLVLILV